ncbi:MAG: phage capsid protein [Burkholderiales bacterium]
MADTAFQTQYRQEFIAGFEDLQSRLRAAVTVEAMIKGNTATFLVADSGSATAKTRGVNGMIPARADNLTQTSATLAEWHDLVRKTGFNVFASQGDQQRVMQETAMGVINRKVDDDIIAQLDTATRTTGAATTASLNLVIKAKVILGNAFVPIEEEDNVFALITPAFEGYMLQVREFASADYVDVKPLSGAPSRSYRRFAGFNWIVHPRLTGVGTTSEKCYFFHRNAVGHAVDKNNIQSPVGYDEEQDYSWARVSVFMGSKLLQNNGVVQALHDGSAYVAS